MSVLPQTVFAQRAAFYTTSVVHKDKAVLDRLVELAHVQPTDHVLDVATGTGHTAFAFAPHVREVIATDITPEMLNEGRRLRHVVSSAMRWASGPPPRRGGYGQG